MPTLPAPEYPTTEWSGNPQENDPAYPESVPEDPTVADASDYNAMAAEVVAIIQDIRAMWRNAAGSQRGFGPGEFHQGLVVDSGGAKPISIGKVSGEISANTLRLGTVTGQLQLQSVLDLLVQDGGWLAAVLADPGIGTFKLSDGTATAWAALAADNGGTLPTLLDVLVRASSGTRDFTFQHAGKVHSGGAYLWLGGEPTSAVPLVLDRATQLDRVAIRAVDAAALVDWSLELLKGPTVVSTVTLAQASQLKVSTGLAINFNAGDTLAARLVPNAAPPGGKSAFRFVSATVSLQE